MYRLILDCQAGLVSCLNAQNTVIWWRYFLGGSGEFRRPLLAVFGKRQGGVQILHSSCSFTLYMIYFLRIVTLLWKELASQERTHGPISAMAALSRG